MGDRLRPAALRELAWAKTLPEGTKMSAIGCASFGDPKIQGLAPDEVKTTSVAYAHRLN